MTRGAAATEPLPGASPAQSGSAIRGVLLVLFGLVEGGLLLFAFRIPHITVHEMLIILAVFLPYISLLTTLSGAGGS